MNATPRTSIRVWDLGIRGFHWLLVAAVAASAITGFLLGRDTLAWHLLAGEAVIVVLCWRIVWGWLGTAHARFASFAYPPGEILAHMRDLRAGRAHRHLGHNPLGAMMVFALILVLLALTLTGAIVLGGRLKQGPLRSVLTYATGQSTLGLHNALAILLLAMIAAHIAGVAYESWRGRENLVRAMLTGNKPASPPAATSHPVHADPVHAHPWTAGALSLILVGSGAAGIARLAALPGLGVPPATPDPVFAEQCGACHLAFPASLAPASSWNAILADLQHHFGHDATLDPQQVAHIKTWLDANSAEHWDSLPSHLLRIPAADGSHRITHAPGWISMHRDIAAAVFTGKPVYSRSACDSCHADAASGRFAPQDIAIPSGG